MRSNIKLNEVLRCGVDSNYYYKYILNDVYNSYKSPVNP